MKPTTILPESYVLYGNFEPRKFKKAKVIPIIATILVAALLLLILDWIFPNNDPAVRSAWQSISVINRIALVILFFYIWLFLHECTHAVFIWLFSGKWPQVKVVKYWGIPITGYTASPGWYFPRTQFIFVVLAPLVLVTPFLYVLSYWVPSICVLLVQDCFLLNIVGSIQDAVVAFFAALHPVSTLITWDGNIYHPWSEADGKDTSWPGRLRSFLERLVSRFS